MADWPAVNEILDNRLQVESPAVRIQTKDEFITKVDDLVRIVTEVLNENLEPTSPSPYARRWWTKELSKLRKKQNKLSSESYKYRHVLDHPSHTDHKAAVKEFQKLQTDTKKQNWIDWLENAEQKDLYLANKYMTSEPSDYSNARIPPLRIKINGADGMAEDNLAKAKALAQSFFPPPALCIVSPAGCDIPRTTQRHQVLLTNTYTTGIQHAQPLQGSRSRSNSKCSPDEMHRSTY